MRTCVKIKPEDNVAIAVKELPAGTEILPGVVTLSDIPQAHKIALQDIPAGGAIVRYLLSHDTKGEILTAAADGDMETLKAKVVNGAGEYILGKVLTGKDDQILTQSVGDHAALVKEGVKKGNYAEATLEIVKSIEKNMFPAVNYADKFAGLTVKMADIWADNTMNEQFETFKKLGGKNISNDDWNTVYIQMYGATHWLSRKGVTAQDIRALFNQRIDNEERIKKEKAEMAKVVAAWKDNNLLSTHYWGRDNGFSATPSLTERLNSLRRIRASLREMLTVDGKLRKGKNYDFATDEEFLLDAVFRWVSNGPKHRDSTATNSMNGCAARGCWRPPPTKPRPPGCWWRRGWTFRTPSSRRTPATTPIPIPLRQARTRKPSPTTAKTAMNTSPSARPAPRRPPSSAPGIPSA